MPRMFVPGPVDVDDEVLQAQTQPMLPHRSVEFEEIFRRASEKAQQLFFTQHRVLLSASSGTGLQEAAIRNFVDRKVLSCVNGAFADRWYDVAVSNGKEAGKLAVRVMRGESPASIPLQPLIKNKMIVNLAAARAARLAIPASVLKKADKVIDR